MQTGVKLAVALAALALAACAQEVPVSTPSRACETFEPYTRETAHLDRADRIWVAGHNAAGTVYCRTQQRRGKWQ